jgi:hypothetical protein
VLLPGADVPAAPAAVRGADDPCGAELADDDRLVDDAVLRGAVPSRALALPVLLLVADGDGEDEAGAGDDVSGGSAGAGGAGGATAGGAPAPNAKPSTDPGSGS